MSTRAGTERTGVHPASLMDAIQRCIVDATNAVILSESGHAFAWTNQRLQFKEPGRYRVSMRFGSLGHACAGVVGAALVHSGKAVAVVGDGAMLFANEVSTAVAERANAVWIVLNDGKYSSCEQGQLSRGLSTSGLRIPRVDFVAYARSLGADGLRVSRASRLEEALTRAMSDVGPYVVDVLVRDVESPLKRRFTNLFGGHAGQAVGSRKPEAGGR
jgi:acetolactate synthase I/II/III large subunit